MTDKRPGVGVGVLIRRNGRVLFGLRRSAHGRGCWAPPAGHLEHGESVVECAKRETLEETGLTLQRPRLAKAFTEDFFPTGKHYITLFVVADSPRGQPVVKEPDKCLEWRFVDWSHLPKPLFLTIRNLKKKKFNPLH